MKSIYRAFMALFFVAALTLGAADGAAWAEMDHSGHEMKMTEDGGHEMKVMDHSDHDMGMTDDGGHEMEETGKKMSRATGRNMGKMLYEMSCVLCHGTAGEGDGPTSFYIGTYSHPRPANYTVGSFKFRSTVSGELPLLEDLMRTIRRGIPGYMPAFKHLGEDGIRHVALYITDVFIGEELPERSTLSFPEYDVPYTKESVDRGREVYRQVKCFECHGMDGRGGRKTGMKDYQDLPIKPMDLTATASFGGGFAPEDIFRTLITGLDSTPMPSYEDSFRGKEADLWDLVNFILYLGGKG